LVAEFPCIKYPQVLADNDYPALDWVRFAARNITLRFSDYAEWMKERINFSRYSLIPVCNLEGDAHLYIIDTLYSRSLTMNKHLLWYSDTSKPDLGGHEDRDFRIYYQEELENPEISNKGFYRGYTVEIDISVLAVNTILQAEYLKDYEEASILTT
jgi:DNA polymerase epsilon subunit 1